MREKLQKRVAELQQLLKKLNGDRRSLHPKSNEAARISVQIFENEARLTEAVHCLNLCLGSAMFYVSGKKQS
jgi:hypothetical protein